MFSQGRRSDTLSAFVARKTLIIALIALVVLAGGCTTARSTIAQEPIDMSGFFPDEDSIPGWRISQPIQTYTHDNLFNLVDGQAESFFAYGFVSVSVQRYQDDSSIPINIEIWQLANSKDAYGLFSVDRSGSPAGVGNDSDSDPGRRFTFWQDRFFVSLNALQSVPDEILQSFARVISNSLPAGGEKPALMSRLPQANLNSETVIFFHEEMSIQMEIWLGGENILGLDHTTDGVIASYTLDEKTARLMLIEFPNTSRASKSLQALQKADIPDLIMAQSRGSLLGAVFGTVDVRQADHLLEDVIE
jgi:hypothetical protein